MSILETEIIQETIDYNIIAKAYDDADELLNEKTIEYGWPPRSPEQQGFSLVSHKSLLKKSIELAETVNQLNDAIANHEVIEQYLKKLNTTLMSQKHAYIELINNLCIEHYGKPANTLLLEKISGDIYTQCVTSDNGIKIMPPLIDEDNFKISIDTTSIPIQPININLNYESFR